MIFSSAHPPRTPTDYFIYCEVGFTERVIGGESPFSLSPTFIHASDPDPSSPPARRPPPISLLQTTSSHSPAEETRRCPYAVVEPDLPDLSCSTLSFILYLSIFQPPSSIHRFSIPHPRPHSLSTLSYHPAPSLHPTLVSQLYLLRRAAPLVSLSRLSVESMDGTRLALSLFSFLCSLCPFSFSLACGREPRIGFIWLDGSAGGMVDGGWGID